MEMKFLFGSGLLFRAKVFDSITAINWVQTMNYFYFSTGMMSPTIGDWIHL